ncbi:hypothetical protein KCU98_g14956, partial [Aureobasidium melanogenum]
AQTDPIRVGGPAQDDFMNSIREQAVFAWALTGINGALHQYGINKAYGESLPLEGLEVWESDPYAQSEIFRSDSGSGLDGMTKGHSPAQMFGDPGLDGYRKRVSTTYGHSQLKTGHPVRSAIHKQLNGRLVLRWVTTWESLLLYVLHFHLSSFCNM